MNTRSVARRLRARAATVERGEAWRFPYDPFPRQQAAHECGADEVLFGGAAGPGKTEWLIAEVIATLFEFPGSAGAIFRRTFTDLSRPGGIIYRLIDRIPPSIGTYHAGEHTWTFANGSVLELAHLERDADVQKYQGAEYQVLGFDQVEQFTFWQYRYMMSRLRASGELARKMAVAGYRPRLLSSANPGGPGHAWVKARWIDPAPAGRVWLPDPTEDEPEPLSRAFIPGKHTDNPALDESYRQRLRNLPDDDRRALEEGDWDVFKGQRFKSFRRHTHVIEPEELPISRGGVVRAIGLDYGLEHPYVALWGAKLPDGLVVVYREDVQAGLTPAQQGARVLALEAPGERTEQRPSPVYADPSTWARQPHAVARSASKSLPPTGSIADDYRIAGLPVRRAQNDRVRTAALVADKLRVRHSGHDPGTDLVVPSCSPRCGPRLLIYSVCVHLIATLPSMVRDPKRPEDVLKTDGDDPYDALRYLLAGLEGLADRPPAGTGRSGRGDLRSRTGGLRKAGF